MEKSICTLLATFVTSAGLNAATITHWSFNSNPPDSNLSTGTTAPALGNGTLTRVNGPLPTFASGVSGGPASGDDSALSTSSYPAQGSGNKTSGIQFSASTRGYTNIVVTFAQRVSNTGSRYFRFQYSTDGSNFTDHSVVDLAPGNVFVTQTVNLGSISALGDNRNFACRIVAEFESTATGSGTDGYVTTTASGYTASGTVRYDALEISGDSINPENTPPRISAIPDQIITENSSTDDIAFFVSDVETLPADLILTRGSSNTNLIPVENIVITGLEGSRTVRVTPAADQVGSAVITFTVTDGGGLSTNTSFVVTVAPANAAPTISHVPHQHTLVGVPTAAVPFTVSDVETPASSLNVTATSSNPSLIPAANIALAGTDADRTATMTPVTGQAGTAVITLTVTDGGNRNVSTSFVLMVLPTAATLLYETFDYPSGSLLTNSASFWSAHDGNVGQTKVDAGRLVLLSSQNEDLHAPLLDGPYGAGSNVTLYASFQVVFTNPPAPSGQYFAHFGSSSTGFRGRVFAATENAAPGTLRLGIANGGGTQSAQFPLDLRVGGTNTVVIRYRVDPPESTLWVNPSAETETGAIAVDAASVQAIGAFSFRQAAGIGQSLIDNVMVGTAFGDVADARPRLRVTLADRDIHVSWPTTFNGYRLQFKRDLGAVSWTDYTGTVDEQDGSFVARLPGVTDNRFFQLVK
jgi:hypothetical protein